MSYPPRFLEELRERCSVTSLVARRVKLQRRGREFLGLCPFHNEKSPSFTVSDEKGFYHCFGCGAHGDALAFLMQAEGLAFPEAVEKLAAEAGLEVPRDTPEQRERQERAAGLHEVLASACAFFECELRLPAGKPALDYLHGRGLTDATIARHRLGFAPDRRGALRASLVRDGIEPDMLVEAGLLKRAEDGRDIYEYFRGRITFPISDRRGRIIAFGGRAMGDAQPKYLNSPDTPVFDKGRVLYNMANARVAARDSDQVVVVEGYMDVIALDQAGIANAVAPLGTALTEDQIRELWKLSPEPVLCFDGDNAGQRAAARAAERALPMLAAGVSLRFASLPSGQDPDDLVRSQGVGALVSLLADARPLVDIVWSIEVARGPTDTPERRAGLERRLAEQVGRIKDPAVRSHYSTDFRNRVAESFRRAAPNGRPFDGRRAKNPAPSVRLPSRRLPSAMADPVATMHHRMQLTVLAALLAFPGLLNEFGDFAAEMDLPPQLDRLRDAILTICSAGTELDGETLVSHLTQAGFAATLSPFSRRKGASDAPVWREFADVDHARASLAHVSAQWQLKLIERDMRERLQQVDENTPEQDLDRFVAIPRLEQSRASGEGGG